MFWFRNKKVNCLGTHSKLKSCSLVHFCFVCFVALRPKSFVCFVALRPKSTAMVMAGRSVHLITLFPGQVLTFFNFDYSVLHTNGRF